MILNVCKCPNCAGTDLCVEVKTWMNVEAADGHADDYPRFQPPVAGDAFDEEDADSAEPIDGGAIICRDCQNQFTNKEK